MDYKRVFGDVLRENRKAAQLSQFDLAEKSGYHKNYISLLETGQRQPSLETIFELAKALGVPAYALIKVVEEKVEGKQH